MIELKGTEYVPGFAIGQIQEVSYLDANSSDKIVLLEEPEIDTVLRLSLYRPSGVILLGSIQFSHIAIYLCSLNLPTVLIDPKEKKVLQTNALVLLDGSTGDVLIDPSEEKKSLWIGHTTNQEQGRYSQIAVESDETRTLDGELITIGASISSVYGATSARIYGADEIGLLRSEFLIAHNSNPVTIESHFNALYEVCSAAAPLPIIIRLLDVGGEKKFNWVPSISDSDKTLGIRGARIYQYEQFTPFLESQLKAISRLSDEYNISPLIPFVSSPKEFIEIRKKISNAIIQPNLRVGAMIETPAMCFSLPEIADIADYIALGTNDLMQCFFGADRSLKTTSKYFEPYSPSLFRFLNLVAASSNSYNIPIQVCGQLPLFPYIAPLLIGLGFRRFSVEPYVIPTLRKVIKELNTAKLHMEIQDLLKSNRINDFKSSLSILLNA